MVDKLDPLGKSALAARLGRAMRGATKPETKSSDAARHGADPSAGATSRAPFGERLARRVSAISPDDPRRRQKAFRAFVEMRLLDEFGAQLANDAAFQQLVDDVVLGMDADAALRGEIEALADRLLESR